MFSHHADNKRRTLVKLYFENEKYTVVFDTQGAGDATAGYKWQNVPSGKTNLKPVAENLGTPVEIGRIVEVGVGPGETLTAQEAVTAVRKAYGESMNSNKYKVTLTSNIESLNA